MNAACHLENRRCTENKTNCIYMNILCGQNLEFLMLEGVAHIITTSFLNVTFFVSTA